MQEMMQQMMAGVVPSGVTLATLPDAASRGARLLVTYCTQCHALPSPQMHTAAEWPAIVARMTERMRVMREMMGRMMMRRMMMGEIRVPTPEEELMLLRYLQAYAMRAAPATIVESDAPGARAFARLCSQCHALPDPAQHSASEWGPVVERMQEHHGQMGRPPMSQKEVEAVVGFLREHAGRGQRQ